MTLTENLEKAREIKNYFIANRSSLRWDERDPWVILSYDERTPDLPHVLYTDSRLLVRLMEISGKTNGVALAYKFRGTHENGSPDLMFISREEAA